MHIPLQFARFCPLKRADFSLFLLYLSTSNLVDTTVSHLHCCDGRDAAVEDRRYALSGGAVREGGQHKQGDRYIDIY